jgi:methyl-accepting chemotaxis protein
MPRFLGQSLMRQLVVIFILVALVPIVTVGYLSYTSAKDALFQSEFRKLNALRNQKALEIQAYLLDVLDAAKFLASYDRVERALLEPASVEKQGPLKGSTETSTQEESRKTSMMAGLNRLMEKYLDLQGKHVGEEDVIIVGRDGIVISTVKKLGETGKDLKTDNLRESLLAKCFEKVVRTRNPVLTDFGSYALVGHPAAFMGVPVFSEKNKQFCGVLIVRLSASRINSIMRVSDAAGATTETYLVGQDYLLRSQPRSSNDAAILKQKVETEAVKTAMEDKSGNMVITDYRGVPVFSSFAHAEVNEMEQLGADFEWAVIAEVDEREAIQPAVELGYRVILIGFVIAALAALTAFFVAKPIAHPITELAEQVSQVSKGNLAVTVPEVARQDEIGILSNAFRIMVENLRDHIGKILEGVNVLSSASTEITATVTQVAASTTQTSSAVSETTTTVEQVKQAARVANEKARTVAQEAKFAVEVSTSGKMATQSTVEKMHLIKDQMESIGETVVRLSEHSRSIEDIIATVQDLADQSNLLAVNASIEAARAGDQGKGFAVVAHEIKTLADQSKEATEQVRSILQETRKWVSAVVMATEQGGKAVEAGV